MKDEMKYNNSSISTTTKSSKRIWLILVVVATVLLNYPHLLFLSMIHQRAPISVNKAIVNQIRVMEKEPSNNNEIESNYMQERGKGLDDGHPITTTSLPYRVHYLMGCHSTPLYSHLHIPLDTPPNQSTKKISIDAWTLGCSPKCRADPNIQCESDNFLSNPSRFMQMAYAQQLQLPADSIIDNHCAGEDDEGSDHTGNICTMNDRSSNDVSQLRISRRLIPHVLVMHENEVLAHNVQDLLQAMNLVEVSRCRHTISSVQLLDADDVQSSHSIRVQIPGLKKIVDIGFEHVIVFVKSDGRSKDEPM